MLVFCLTTEAYNWLTVDSGPLRKIPETSQEVRAEVNLKLVKQVSTLTGIDQCWHHCSCLKQTVWSLLAKLQVSTWTSTHSKTLKRLRNSLWKRVMNTPNNCVHPSTLGLLFFSSSLDFPHFGCDWCSLVSKSSIWCSDHFFILWWGSWMSWVLVIYSSRVKNPIC